MNKARKLSKEAIERLEEHIEAVYGTAGDDDDRQLASDLRTLMDFYKEHTGK
jgi:hypothetical protein